MEHDDSQQLGDAALVAKIIRECPHRLAKESSEGRLPGWFPRPPTPSHMWLAELQFNLSLYKMSGQKCVDFEVTNLKPSIFRDNAFRAMAAHDAEFPIDAEWFLQRIKFTPIERSSQSSDSTCTVVFPVIEFDDSRYGWSQGFSWGEAYDLHDPPWLLHDAWASLNLPRIPPPPSFDPLNYLNRGSVQDGRKIVVGKSSDSETLLAGFYLASTHEQYSVLARIIANSGVSCMCEPSYLSAAKKIFTSPKFTAVNFLKETYKGVEHDTTLWHLLLAEHKRWNYPEFSEIFNCLLSRSDLDLSHSGWSWAMGDTISAAELCFFEWCAIIGKSPKRQLWVDTAIPRLCLLSACLYPRSAGSDVTDVQICHQLNGFIDKESRIFKRKDVLRNYLLQDLSLLASEELFTLPWFLKSEVLHGLIIRLRQ